MCPMEAQNRPNKRKWQVRSEQAFLSIPLILFSSQNEMRVSSRARYYDHNTNFYLILCIVFFASLAICSDNHHKRMGLSLMMPAQVVLLKHKGRGVGIETLCLCFLLMTSAVTVWLLGCKILINCIFITSSILVRFCPWN